MNITQIESPSPPGTIYIAAPHPYGAIVTRNKDINYISFKNVAH